MSRIEQALRRARGAQPQPDDQEPDALPAPSSSVSDDPAADSPWNFDAKPSTPTTPPASARHVPVPRPSAHARVEPSLVDSGVFPTPVPQPGRRGGPLGVFDGFDQAVEERVVAADGISPLSVEQYRRLAATLHHAQADRGIRRVMITSAVAGEGKSLTSTNLALTLSQSYLRNVLLIDADLRRPSIHRIFRVQNMSGLTDGLKSSATGKLPIIQISDHLSILTAGRPDRDPMGALTSDRMTRILDEASTKFDWIIIDTPPVGLLPDANLLASMVDAAILVVGAAQAPHDVIRRGVESIGRDKILGVVLNRVDQIGSLGVDKYRSYYEDYTTPR
jgi:protein-tyrosine kinase